MDVEARIDELFAAPIEEFTTARNDLVKELNEQGEKEAAVRVKALRKPPTTVWAINQLAHKHGPELEELIGIHEGMAAAKGAEDLRRISGERRRVVGRLTDLATKILHDAGHGTTSTTVQRISQMLLAASTGEELDALRWGRVTGEIEGPGFGAVGGFEETMSDTSARELDRKTQERVAKLSRAAEEAAREAAKLTRAAASAEQDARRLEAKALRAQRKADDARQKAEEAHRKAEEAAQRI